jgi:hypothetical protein
MRGPAALLAALCLPACAVPRDRAATAPPTDATQYFAPSEDQAPLPPPIVTLPGPIGLRDEGGALLVPVTINGALTLDFVVDSGAADVSIPEDVILTLIRTGTIRHADFLGRRTYRLADGSTVPSELVRIGTLKVGGYEIDNVTVSAARVAGAPLLGQSFLRRFRSWSIDNHRRVLILQ